MAPLLNPSFPPAHSEKMRFLFVLSSVAKYEKILMAELHLFRLWPRATDGPKKHHFCQVRRGMGWGCGWGQGWGQDGHGAGDRYRNGDVPQPVPGDATGTLRSLACSGSTAWVCEIHTTECRCIAQRIITLGDS